MHAQMEKLKENKSRAESNTVGRRQNKLNQDFGFVDNRHEAVAQRKLQKGGNNSQNISQLRVKMDTGICGIQNVSSKGCGSVSKSVLQRKILVGTDWEEHTDNALVNAIKADVEPRLNNWPELKDNIFKKKTNSTTNTAVNTYYNTIVPDTGVTQFEADVLASLRKNNNRMSFADRNDLFRQVTQDIKLILLGFHNIAGVPHHDGQFKRTNDGFGASASGRGKKLVIYRTMYKADWNNYKVSGDLKDILFGHGGSLGQAMHYFNKSRKDSMDDVLVEFKFSSNASMLVDYLRVNGGGEGGAPQDNKLTGKSEQNDIMKVDTDVFSVHLTKSKDLIKRLKPQVRLVAQVL